MLDVIAETLRRPEVHPILMYLVTLFGASAMYMFSLHKGFHGAVDFLVKIFPGRQEVFYHRADAFVVIFAGSLIGTIVYSPSNPLQALAAGFGWVGAINILTNQGVPRVPLPNVPPQAPNSEQEE